MEDSLNATASCTKELTKEIGSSGVHQELVSPEHEEYRAKSYDQVDEFHFDVTMSVIQDEGAIEQNVAVAVSA